MRALIAAVILILAPGHGWAQVVSTRSEATSVVIYPEQYQLASEDWDPSDQYDNGSYGNNDSGLALVSEQRTVDLPAGESVIRFEGVAEAIVPQTATVTGLPSTVREQNFDYALLTPATLIAHAIDQPVRLVRTNPATGEEVSRPAIIRSGPNGVVLEVDGRLEALRCSGSAERIVFDTLPENLMSRPTLSARVSTSRAGRYVIRLTYLTTGLHWRADYVARLLSETQINLSGWITLTNDSGTTFDSAQVQVVAGALSRTDETVAEPIETPQLVTNCQPPPTPRPRPPPEMTTLDGVAVTGSYVRASAQDSAIPVSVIGSAQRENLGDLKLYTIPWPTTISARQTKQVALFDSRVVSFERSYGHDITPYWYEDEVAATAQALVLLRTRNLERNGLGLPLPAGAVAWVDTLATGRTLFAGAGRFGNIAEGLPILVRLMPARGLDVRTTRVSSNGDADRNATRVTYRYEVTNRRSETVTFQFNNAPSAEYGLTGRYPRPQVEEGLRVWRSTLRPGETFTLTLTYERTPEPD